ncbi:MAG: hypothetical protein ACTSPW_20245 [Promethearchaeota archaeon]
MSFIEGMFLCFIGGWINSYIYRKYLRKRNKGWLFWFALIFVGGIMTFDILIYTNIIDIRKLIWAPWVSIPKDVDAGRYYMWNPGLLLGIQFKSHITPGTGFVWELFAYTLFLSYIWWFTIGQNMSRVMYGRLQYERGAWYLLRTTKMVKKSLDKLEAKSKSIE